MSSISKIAAPLMGFGGVIAAASMLLAAPAHADGNLSVVEKAYADTYHSAICDNLDDYPSVGGVLGTWQGVQKDSGLTLDNAGDVIDYAVQVYCPKFTGLLQRTADAIEDAQKGRQV